jgi:hypothetical protein
VLPTTSSAISAAAASVADGETGHVNAPAAGTETVEKFEGLLWSGVLAPLSQAIGPLGDVFTNALGAGIARDQHDAFYQHLRALVELSATDAGVTGANDRTQ